MEQDGLKLILSPIQLAAILSDQRISDCETRLGHVMGGVKAMSGALEMVGAAALLLTPEPTLATKAAGATLAVYGADELSAGLLQAWSGCEQATLTRQAATGLARGLGANGTTADRIGASVEIAVPFLVASALGAVRVLEIHFGRIALAEHEASASVQGGHTIARHIGKTEAELRSRLIAEPKISAASSFKSLELAEHVLYKAIRANRVNIESWARHANPGAKLVLRYSAKDVVGSGIVRSSGTLVETNRVLVVLKLRPYNGRLYYILTSFPDP